MSTSGQSVASVDFAVFSKPWATDSIDELAERIAELGFNSAEVPVRPGFQVEPQSVDSKLPELVAAFAKQGLRVCSVASTLDEPIFAACSNSGVPVIRVMAPVTRGDYLRSEASMRDSLLRAQPLCQRYGVRIGVQEHYGDHVHVAVGLRGLLSETDRRFVGAVFDAAHDALGGMEPENGLDVLWDRLVMVNFKNAYYERTNGPEAPSAEWRRHFTTGRQGLASWPRIVTDLKRRHYARTVCLTAEYDAGQDEQRLCSEDLAYLKELFAANG
jgi:sugar phosphate isomerase/epimerase